MEPAWVESQLKDLDELPYFFAVEVESDKMYFVQPQAGDFGSGAGLVRGKGTRRLVPLKATADPFSTSVYNLTKSALDKYRLLAEQPVKPLVHTLDSCGANCFDERIRVELEKAWIVQAKPLLHNIRPMGPLVNAPLSILNGTCVSITTKRPFKTHAHRSYMYPYELRPDCTFGPNEDTHDLRLSAGRRRLNFSDDWILNQCEDVRTVELPGGGRLGAVYTINRINGIRPQYYLGYIEALLDEKTRGLRVDVRYQLSANIVESGQDIRGEKHFTPHRTFGYKNWSPLVHNGSVLFVQRLNPLQITTISAAERAAHSYHDYVNMDLVSQSPPVRDFWRLGQLRGGTPFVRISADEYLTIFHTMCYLPHNSRGTYFFGAMTISAGGPPFRTLRVSAAPIVHEALYQGAWMRQRFDYVYYPMAVVFELRAAGAEGASANSSSSTGASASAGPAEESRYTNAFPAAAEGSSCAQPGSVAHRVWLLLSFGVQDADTQLADVNLCALLSTTVRVLPLDAAPTAAPSTGPLPAPGAAPGAGAAA